MTIDARNSLELTFDLHGHGWGRLIFTSGHDVFSVENVSYLTCPLSDLVHAAIRVALRHYTVDVDFAQEPGRFRLTIDWAYHDLPIDSDDAESSGRRRRLRLFDCGTDDEESLAVVWEIETNEDDLFPRAVVSLAEGILRQHGALGFRQLWSESSAFPRRGLAALKAALAVVDDEVEW